MIYTLTLNPAVDRELTVPSLAYDTVLRATHARVDFGGKGFNVSRLLAGLGAPTTAVGFLGGRAGELLRDGLLAQGIGVDCVWVDGETRTNVSIVSQQDGHYLKVNEAGPPIPSHKSAELLAKITALARPGGWWVLSGSLPPGLPDDAYAPIIQALNQRGANALLDTSGPPLRLGCLARPFLVKPNAEEAAALTGLPIDSPADARRAAAAIHALGPRHVVISLGKHGALLYAPTGTWLAHSPPITQKNPTGAGDSLLGALTWALASGCSLPQALAWGVAAGAATASLAGTTLGSRPLIESLLPLVRIEEI